MEIIDVTLRDGGFTCDFDWPLEFAQEYYNLISGLSVSSMELGYWKQSSKSSNRFFDLNLETINEITGGRSLKNTCVMIDYHYCSKNLEDYPTFNQGEVGLIRMTARKDMIKDAYAFALRLKEYTGLNFAFNIFNTTNYSSHELNKTLDLVLDSDFDIIGFADTHGHLDLEKDLDHYDSFFKRIKDNNKKTSFHLHNHTGKAYLNYLKCKQSDYIDICDTSIRGLGKGAGNLKLEEVVSLEESVLLTSFINKYYNQLFNKPVNPYYLITGRFGITDNYATQAIALQFPPETFSDFCQSLNGVDRDNFNQKLLEDYINELLDNRN